MRDIVTRDELLELVEELDAVMRGPVVDLARYQDVRGRLAAAAERHAVRLKLIADIANYGRPARATLRYALELVKHDGGNEAA